MVLDQDSTIRELDAVRTDRTGQALLTTFDGSTILLYPESEIAFSRLQVSVFAPKANYVTVDLRRGKALIAVARPAEGRTDFTVTMPQGRAVLLEGSYAVIAGDVVSTVKVRERGRALVTGGTRTVDVRERERTELAKQPSDPMPAAANLVENSDFSNGLANWQKDNDPFCQENTPTPAKITLTNEAGQPIVKFTRSGSQGTACETFIRQDLNIDVSEFFTLRLAADVDVISQSLSGGGTLGSEYPLMLRVRYRAVDGTENTVVLGFYVENTAKNRVDNGVPLRQGVWDSVTYDQDIMALSPRPRQILSIDVVAGGHDYESMIRRVSLIGE